MKCDTRRALGRATFSALAPQKREPLRCPARAWTVKSRRSEAAGTSQPLATCSGPGGAGAARGTLRLRQIVSSMRRRPIGPIRNSRDFLPPRNLVRAAFLRLVRGSGISSDDSSRIDVNAMRLKIGAKKLRADYRSRAGLL